MRPIGASVHWRWEGYRNSTVKIDGQQLLSVPGGSHWGGGVFIHAEDQARIGLMMLARGDWAGRRILSTRWIDLATHPCSINATYGYLWWLNTDHGYYLNASPQSYFAIGAGGRPIVVTTLNGDTLDPILSSLISESLLSWFLLLVKIIFQHGYVFNIFCSHNLFSSASKILRRYHFANFSRCFGLIYLASRCRTLGSS
jgi:hypothetical protein